MKHLILFIALAAALSLSLAAEEEVSAQPAYRIVGTNQSRCYDDFREIRAPQPGRAFYGQDAQHPGPAPAYTDNGDGTVTDRVTGLMWVKARGEKVAWDDCMAGAAQCRVGGHDDWRMPSIKELYSLIDFTGAMRMGHGQSQPFLDSRVFEFRYGNTQAGERDIDCQDWSSTAYLGTTMNGNATVFGVNFADGRIKGYPKTHPGRGNAAHRLYARYVRGNPAYGKNAFHDNGDGTITDCATGLMWSKADSGKGMNWGRALGWVQERNRKKHLGHADWRLPNAKELQSLVDYARAPDAKNEAQRGPAIDKIFQITKLADGEYPFFWSSTTHLDGPPDLQAHQAVYVCFGRGLGWMSENPGPPGRGRNANVKLMDVHGAGAQRSDPKSGDAADFPHGRGPQGDVIRIENFVRLVRGPIQGGEMPELEVAPRKP